MIKIFHLGKAFPAKGVVFDELGLRVKPGEFVLLSGASGSGKSCLLRIIAGYLRPDTGQVLVAGWDLSRLDEVGRLALRQKVSLVSSDVMLLEDRSAEENVTLGLRVRDVGRAKGQAVGRRWLDAFGLGEMRRARPSDLSRGEQVKLALARALASGPQLLLLDEPAANLDAANLKMVARVISEAHGGGLTVLWAGKEPAAALPARRRLIELKEGKAVEKW